MTASKVDRIPDASELDLDEKLGQMLLLGFRGTRLTDDNPIVSDIRDHKIGGVILFDYEIKRATTDRNISSPEQVAKLTSDLKEYADIPLIVSIDQEGGLVNRLKPEFGFSRTLSHKELGEKNDLDFTRRHAREIAGLVKASGHNMNFAPCVDLGINKENKAIYLRERCFSDDPEAVALHASAYVRGHREAGVLTALKHFPGHGSSKEDTHLGMADVTDTWQEYEILPYQRILEEGLCQMIMTTHIFNRKLDETWPATLSRKILDGILRRQLGFDGVIISDDLQMKAITEHFGEDEVMKQALRAGVDVLAYGNNLDFEPDLAERFLRIAGQMLEDGEITIEQIDASVSRILNLKKQFYDQPDALKG